MRAAFPGATTCSCDSTGCQPAHDDGKVCSGGILCVWRFAAAGQYALTVTRGMGGSTNSYSSSSSRGTCWSLYINSISAITSHSHNSSACGSAGPYYLSRATWGAGCASHGL